MSMTRPNFEKKELAISGSPYVYLPVDIPAYTWRSPTAIPLTESCSSGPWIERFSGCPICPTP